MKYIIQFVAFAIWVAGFVLAKGFWSTLACLIPFWSWYLVLEAVLQHFGVT